MPFSQRFAINILSLGWATGCFSDAGVEPGFVKGLTRPDNAAASYQNAVAIFFDLYADLVHGNEI